MSKKYYTPEIEEFHVGFEYEKYTDMGIWVKQIIEKKHLKNCTIGQGSGFDKKPWFDFKVRVKYLDREDIESLGFKVKKEPYRWQFVKNYVNLTTAIYNSKEDIPHDRITIRGGDNYFDGIIKNKSELKKLLKQLGVNGK